MEKRYFDELMSSLEDAATFAQGDPSRARVVEVDLGKQELPVCGWDSNEEEDPDEVDLQMILEAANDPDFHTF